jgi:hypothetical protein
MIYLASADVGLAGAAQSFAAREWYVEAMLFQHLED